MIYEGHLFDFPGRRYAFTLPRIGREASIAALRAIAHAVEPTVVEATCEPLMVFHLVAGQAKGGAYIRDPARTVSVPRIDETALVLWFEQLTRRGEPVAEVSIDDG